MSNPAVVGYYEKRIKVEFGFEVKIEVKDFGPQSWGEISFLQYPGVKLAVCGQFNEIVHTEKDSIINFLRGIRESHPDFQQAIKFRESLRDFIVDPLFKKGA